MMDNRTNKVMREVKPGEVIPTGARKVNVWGGRTADDRGVTIKRVGRKIGRNEACPCGSGKKFKNCHSTGDAWTVHRPEKPIPYEKPSMEPASGAHVGGEDKCICPTCAGGEEVGPDGKPLTFDFDFTEIERRIAAEGNPPIDTSVAGGYGGTATGRFSGKAAN